MSEMSEAALRYAHMGLSVIPLWPRAKNPIFRNWTEIATADESMVSRWWKQNPDANVGIVTGQKSRCFVLDIDAKNGGLPTYESLVFKHGQFPDTWQDLTGGEGGGFHLYFRYPNFPVHNAAGIFPGIDIRGDGGQVVAPPSIHPETGNRYAWDGLKEIEETPLAEAPLWLLDVLQGKSERTTSDKFPMVQQIPQGVRHDTMVAMAGKFRSLGLTKEEIIPSMMAVNKSRCEHPIPDAEIIQIADSMMKYRPSDGNLVSVANRLWRVTKRKEIEHKEAQDARTVPTTDGLAVYRAPVAEQRMVVENVLYHGLTIFAGRPKVGKSWLTLQLAMSVSQGVPFLGYPVLRPGKVVYAALEEGQSRTSGRMHKLQPAEHVMLQNISMAYTMRPMMAGGKEQLEELITQQTPNLVIIDTFLSFVGSGGNVKRDVLRGEYADMDVLHKLAQKYDTAIVIVHHMRKPVVGGKGLDAVAGSTGLTAAADAVWTMDREDDGICSIDMVGRECEEQTLALRFLKEEGNFGWELMGTGDKVKTMKDEKEITILLREEGALGIQKISGLLRMNANRVRSIMYEMHKFGTVVRQSNGNYSLDMAYTQGSDDAED